jgi:hypothetical protein
MNLTTKGTGVRLRRAADRVDITGASIVDLVVGDAGDGNGLDVPTGPRRS